MGAHTTTFVTTVVEHSLEREIAQWVHPMKDRPDDPSHHERTLLPRSYISLVYSVVVSGRIFVLHTHTHAHAHAICQHIWKNIIIIN